MPNITLPVNTSEVISPFENIVISGYDTATIQSFIDPSPDILLISAPSATSAYTFYWDGQFSVVANTVNAGSWTASSGSNLVSMIDEVGVLDTTDYIISGATPYEDTVKFNLTGLELPSDGTTKLFVWARKVS